MIYIHRFIFLVLYLLVGLICILMFIGTFVVFTPFYALAYFVRYGMFVSEEQVENMCRYIPCKILSLLEYIEPE